MPKADQQPPTKRRFSTRSTPMHSSNQRASTAWTPQEDQTLLDARAQGQNWAPIQSTHFPTKTPNACRKRHERLMERRNVEDWDDEKLENLAREYLNMRRDMWTMLASRVGEKWQVVESKCMEKGLKNIQSASRSATRKEKSASGNDDSRLSAFDPDVEEGETSELKPEYEHSDDGKGSSTTKKWLGGIVHGHSSPSQPERSREG